MQILARLLVLSLLKWEFPWSMYHNRYKDKYFKVAHKLPKHGWGRTLPSDYVSLSVMHRPTRHALCDTIYRDLDMTNAHTTIIYEVGLQNDMVLPFLKQIVDDPKGWREKIGQHNGLDHKVPEQRDRIKKILLSLLYGGSYETWIRDNNIEMNEHVLNPVMEGVQNEMSHIRETVYHANQHILTDVMRHNDGKWTGDVPAFKRGVMALWAQTIERGIMEDVVMYLARQKKFKLEDVVPCQDGLMILKELWYDGIETDLQRAVQDKFGFSLLRSMEKPFDEAITIPVHDVGRNKNQWEIELASKSLIPELFALPAQDDSKFTLNALPAQDDSKFTLNDYIVRTNEGRLYVFHYGRWYDESDPKKYIHITKYISEDLYKQLSKKIESAVELSEKEMNTILLIARNVTSDSNKINNIIRHIKTDAKLVKSSVFDSQPYLIGHENGVVDLREGTFRPYRFDDFITITTCRDYIKPDYTKPDVTKMKETLQTILNEIQEDGDIRNLLMQIMASGLDGILYQSLWFLNGSGGNGKSLLSRLMQFILGPQFCYSPRADLVKEVSKANMGSSPDIADMQHKRYIILPELQGKVHMAMLKRMTGGDMFTARQLYEGNVQFHLSATIVAEFNEQPEFDAKLAEADTRRINNVGFNNNWTSYETKIGKTIDGKFYRRANEYYASQEFVASHADIFLDMLMDVYVKSYMKDGTSPGFKFNVPESICRASKDFIDKTNVFKRCFDTLYEPIEAIDNKIDNKKNHIKFSSMWDSIVHNQMYCEGKRARTREYSEHWCKKQFYSWLQTEADGKWDSDSSKAKFTFGYKSMGEEDMDDSNTEYVEI